MNIKQKWEKDSASPQPIFVIGSRDVSDADMAAAIEQFGRRDTGLTKRELLITAIAGPMFAAKTFNGDIRVGGTRSNDKEPRQIAHLIIGCADAIIAELQRRDDKSPVVREDAKPKP